jgi:uncharacterized protein (TIGR00251 family)
MEADLHKIISENDSNNICVPFWVQPRASVTKISGIYQECIKISLSSPPVDGKANSELCKFLSKKLSLPKSSVKIISGQTSRKKVIKISGTNKKSFIASIIK